MSRDPTLLLEDIAGACDRIATYTLGVSEERFRVETMMVDAVVRNLQVIGDATKRLPPELRQKYPDVPWREAAAMRDVLVHGYFGIDLDLVWDVVRRDVPVLRSKVGAILAQITRSGSA